MEKATDKVQVSCAFNKEVFNNFRSINDVIAEEAPLCVIMDMPPIKLRQKLPIVSLFFQNLLSVVYRTGVPVLMPSSDINISDMKKFGIINNVVMSVDFKRRFRKLSYFMYFADLFHCKPHLFIEKTSHKGKSFSVNGALHIVRDKTSEMDCEELFSEPGNFFLQLLEYAKTLNNPLLLIEVDEWHVKTAEGIKEFLDSGNKASVLIVKSPQKEYRL